MNETPIRIILVDDHKIVRDSLKMMLHHNPRLQVIADCDNGYAALEEAERHMPEIMLVDINMSPMNGLDLTEKIKQKFPSINIIGMSANNQPTYAVQMMKLGAMGYLTKTSSPAEINHGILQVYSGNKYICEEISKHLTPQDEIDIE